MRVRILLVSLIALGGLFILFNQTANATTTITPETIEKIRNHCTENQATLNRLHQTDAFLRINRGELYRTIGDKLMVPLNRRLASNQLDAGSLLTITADYNNEYRTFFNAYIEYDNEMTKLLSIDCSKEPVTFYNALVNAREMRDTLSSSNKALQDIVRAYGTEFTTFKSNYEADK